MAVARASEVPEAWRRVPWPGYGRGVLNIEQLVPFSPRGAPRGVGVSAQESTKYAMCHMGFNTEYHLSLL